jgi:hypothetical protein
LRGWRCKRNSRITRSSAEAGFAPLFNGTDLAGWKTHPEAPGDWRVESGILIGRINEGSPRKHSQLFTERGDYQDVIFRAETKINQGGNSGLHVRIPFSPKIGGGYEAQISSSHRAQNGTLFFREGKAEVLVEEKLVPPDTWFNLEIRLLGN